MCVGTPVLVPVSIAATPAGERMNSDPVADSSVVAAFSSIATDAELDEAIAAARKARKPVMLDFTADWCAPCKRMQKRTFADPAVQAALSQFVLLRVDVTKDTVNDEVLLKRFKAQGPPVIAFFDAKGHELKSCQLNSFMEATKFYRFISIRVLRVGQASPVPTLTRLQQALAK